MVSITLAGNVNIGLGRGSYFMSQPIYRKQFIRKLGIDPYRGTLNLTLTKANLAKLNRIRKSRGITIKGFKKGKKTFGDVVCYMADACDVKCALVIPKRSTHVGVAELISQKKLREVFDLKDGDVLHFNVKI
jgi:riboflavin kinase, archaea type